MRFRTYAFGVAASISLIGAALAATWTPYSPTEAPVTSPAYIQIYPPAAQTTVTYALVGALPTNTIASLGTTCTTTQAGQEYYVTDAASSPVYNATVTGSGTTHIVAMCNGTNWTNH